MVLKCWQVPKEMQEEVKITGEELLAKVQQIVGADKQIHMAGSTIKGTYLLNGKPDFDIYVLTPDIEATYNVLSEEFGGREKKGALKIWATEFKGYPVDLVIVDPENIRTATIEHTPFYMEQLTVTQKDDVRKLKAFLKQIGTYGAELLGFSGVACEELIRKYGNFDNATNEIETSERFWLQDARMTTPRDLLASVNPERWERTQNKIKQYKESKLKIQCVKYSVADFKRNHPSYSFFHDKRDPDTAIAYQVGKKKCGKVCTVLEGHNVKCECDIFVEPDKRLVAFKVEPEKFKSSEYEHCLDLTKVPEHVREQAIKTFKERHGEKNIKGDANRLCVIKDRGFYDVVAEFKKLWEEK